MHDDPGYARFFAYLNLFVFSMTMLVLAGNFLLLYVFWEAVGLCSYLLIGFWYTRPVGGRRRARRRSSSTASATSASASASCGCGPRSARSTTRERLRGRRRRCSPATATGIALLLFVGACGKSAQLPLHMWLPDAMEGPTPVSALIHAATMVTAGVYMVARSHALFERSGDGPRGRGLGRRGHRALRGDASPSSRPTSSACSPTRPSASSATCSRRSGSARTPPASSTSSPTPSSRRCSSSARAA